MVDPTSRWSSIELGFRSRHGQSDHAKSLRNMIYVRRHVKYNQKKVVRPPTFAGEPERVLTTSVGGTKIPVLLRIRRNICEF